VRWTQAAIVGAYSSCGPELRGTEARFRRDGSLSERMANASILRHLGRGAASRGISSAGVGRGHRKDGAAKIREKLREGAERLAKVKHDCETGFGRIRLP